MTPVCPACRVPVRLDAYICPRCGLAMRPTCARCAEPLMAGMTACWRCGEQLSEPPPTEVALPAPVAPRAAVAPVVAAATASFEPRAAVTTPMAPAEPVYEEVLYERPAPPVEAAWQEEGRRRRGVFRWFFIVLLAGLLVAGGLLLLAMFAPTATRTPPEDVELGERVFGDLGLIVSLPPAWQVSEERASFVATDPREIAGRPVQGVRVALDDRTPSDMEGALGTFNRARVEGYVPFRTDLSDRVLGSETVYHAFLANGLRYEQWWIAHEGGSIWVEFWSRQVDDNAFVLHRRILESLELL